jgi:hypothetical protein
VELANRHWVEVVQLVAADALHGDEMGCFEHVEVLHHTESCEMFGLFTQGLQGQAVVDG